MTPAELMATRESLGLTRPAVASLVGVSARTWRSWETDPSWEARGVPADVVAALTHLDDAMNQHVREHEDQAADVLVCYRDDDALHAAHPGSTMPAITHLLAQARLADRMDQTRRGTRPRLVWDLRPGERRAGDQAVLLADEPEAPSLLTSAEFVAYCAELGITQHWLATAIGATDKAIYEWGKGTQQIPADVTKIVFALLDDVNDFARRETYRDTTEPIALLCYRDTHQVAYDPDGPYLELPPAAHRAAQLRITRALREAGHTVTLNWAPLNTSDQR